MFAGALALLSAVALASAAGLKSSATADVGNEDGNWTLQDSEYGYSLAGSQPIDLSISAIVEDGELKMLCPYNLTAVLIPSDDVYYTVEFVNSTDGLPEGTITGGWNTTDDRFGIPLYGETYTKVINEIGPGRFDLVIADGRNELSWFNQSDTARGFTEWFIVLDSAQDVEC
ncbi:hypothetical protein BD626DRAFT_180323 [Schizophyllum amplum]|uniref:Uncharacterized protein n=1 Tax=Schizophyllum amplum TaxID=97359 RepID=A0A550C216_9AGAR|nr:hypothetical protein BD626DRAFT_180323 [Auriculariopsis ampla]